MSEELEVMAERYRKYVYFNCLIKDVAETFSEISRGYNHGPGHIQVRCIPTVIAQKGNYVVVQVNMDAGYPFLENEWVERFAMEGI